MGNTPRRYINNSNGKNRLILLGSSGQEGVHSGDQGRTHMFGAVGKKEEKKWKGKIEIHEKIKGTNTNLYWEVLLELSENKGRGIAVKKKYLLDISNRIKVSFYLRTDKVWLGFWLVSSKGRSENTNDKP